VAEADAIQRDPFSGPAAGFIWEKLAVRDFAAFQLSHQLELDDTVDASWNDENWAELRVKVQRALAERESSKNQKGMDK